MDNIPEFPKKPSRPEDWPWSMLRDMIEGQVKLSDGLPEGAAEAVAARMKPGVLQMVDRARGITSGCSMEIQDQLVELVAEMFADRLILEMEFERERMRT